MTIPGFTAEAALGKTNEGYALRTRAYAESGSVLPQFCFQQQPGSNYVTCGGCVDTDGDGVPDTCWYSTHLIRATLF